jgi:hypothetical protein
VGASTLVWTQGMQSWQSFGRVLAKEPRLAALAMQR